ncbi:HEAT repeat domain-containing protein [Roseibium sp. HPY-6]|uniref:HEAT repeat domain-containing protein n=1 Tax=Roseibium sp. HPY-6 TaxID=3229852 RepID=UPI00338E5C58
MTLDYSAVPDAIDTITLDQDIQDNLLKIAGSGSPAEQCLAIKAIGAWSFASAREALREALRNDDPDVRVDALQALVKLEEKNLGKDFLWSLENDPVSEAKVEALQGLCLEDRDLAEPLLRKLVLDRCEDTVAWEDDVADWDDWLDVQKEVIRTIGRLGIEEAVEELLSAANDEFGQDVWREVLEAFAGLGRPGLLALIDAGQSPDVRQRERAARALGGSEDAMAVKALEALARDAQEDVRLAALETLLERGADPNDQQMIDDASAKIRAFAAAKSPTIGTDDLIGLALADEDKSVRLAAVTRLDGERLNASRTAKLVSHLRSAVRSETVEIVCALVTVLGRSEHEDALDLLLDIQKHNSKPEIQRAVLSTLANFARPEVLEPLTDGITSKSQSVRLSALASLADLSEGDGSVADNAAAMLLLAARGDLAPEDSEQNKDQDNENEEEKQFGARARDDDGGSKNRIVLDREGNIVPQEETEEPVRLSDYRKPEATDELEGTPEETDDLPEPVENGIEQEETAEIVAFPQSTLAAILQGDEEQAQFQEEKIDLSDEDLKFLELAQSTLKKKRVRPDVAPNTAIDIRRIAVRLIGELTHTAFTSVLLEALEARDDELRTAALTSLSHRHSKGVLLELSEWARMSEMPPENHPPARAAYLDLLSCAPADHAHPVLENALEDEDNTVRVAALCSFEKRNVVPERIPAFLRSVNRETRRAALGFVCRKGDPGMIDGLVDATFDESGALWAELALLLGRTGPSFFTERVLEKLDQACSEGGVNRQIALQVLAALGRSQTKN